MTANPQPIAAMTFDERIFNHLREFYPNLEESVLRMFPSELMEVLRLRASSEMTTEGRAYRIPDHLPEWMNELAAGDVAATEQAVPAETDDSTALVTIDEDQKHCMEMLNHMTQLVASGSVRSLCVMAMTKDGNQQLLFNLPAENLFGFYGFLGYSLGIVCGQGNQSDA